MEKKSITKNYIYNLVYQMLILIVPLFTTPYLSRVLGAGNIGVYSYTLSIATYFILFGSLGSAMYAQREIAFNQDNEEKRSKIFYEIIILRFFTLLISSIIFYFTFTMNGEYQFYYKILLLEIFATFLDISWFFQGLEEFKKTVTRNIIIKIMSIACIFIFVKDRDDLTKYFIVYIVSNVIGNASLWLYLPKYLKKISIESINIIKHIKPTLTLFIPQIAIQIYTVLDKTMIGSIVKDISEVGYYEQSQKIIRMLLTIVTSLGIVMVPRIANTFAKGDKIKINSYINRSFNFVYFLGIPIMFGIIAISNDFIPLFLGQGYEKAIKLMYVISPIILFIGLSNVIGTQYLIPTKRQKQFTISVTLGALINLVLNFILIPKLFSVGAAIGTVIAEMIVTLIQFYMIRKDMNIKEAILISKNYWIAGICMFIASYFSKYLFDNRLIIIATQVILGGIMYISILFIMKDKFLNEITNKILNKYKK